MIAIKAVFKKILFNNYL